MPILFIKNGPHKGLEVDLKGDSLVIGRDELPDGLQILDQGVSRRHAEVFRIGERHVIRVLGSRNGTFVNEEKITEELLREGDELKIGSTTCVFQERKASRRSRKRGPSDRIDLDAMSATATMNLDLDLAVDDDLVLDPTPQETQESQDLQILYRVAKTIASERDIKGLARKVVKLAANAVGASLGYLLIKHPDKSELTLAGSFDRDGKDKKREREAPVISRTVIKRVLKTNRGVMTNDAAHDERFKDRGSVIMKGIRSVICVPLVAMDQICGVLYLSSRGMTETFGAEDLELATAVGIQAGMAVQGITLSLAQEKNYLELVSALVRAMEMRDPISRGHSERVAMYSSGIAQAMGLSRSRNRRIQLAALLHNTGALFMRPEEAANAPGDVELDTKRIELACQLLEKIQGMSFLVPAVRHHRERYDGKGYPEGLEGDDIPLEARIISVANDFDLALHKEPEVESAEDLEDMATRGTQDPGEIVETMLEDKSRYDPKVLEGLATAQEEGWLFKPQERVKV